MSKGLSIHIGLNHVSPIAYKSIVGRLFKCELDAQVMKNLAQQSSFEVLGYLINREATKANFIALLGKARKRLSSGDILLISFSGHGGRLIDINNDERDGFDETWCMYDGHLVDDLIHQELCKFTKDIRILIISDSCHSGTIIKPLTNLDLLKNKIPVRNPLKNSKTKPCASIQLISACQDNEYAKEGDNLGRFTEALVKKWNDGNFNGNYTQLMEQIINSMPLAQTPNHFFLGKNTKSFILETPFQI